MVGAHWLLLGTASPTHYTIVYNDMIEEELQKQNSKEYIEFKRDI